MWQTVISIDSKYTNEIDLIKQRLEKLSDIYFAREVTSSRVFFNIAGKENSLALTECKLMAIVADLICVNLKMRYFLDIAKGKTLDLPLSCLIASLVYYDHDKEFEYINKSLESVYEYSIDGLLNFRFKELLQDWEEMSDLLLNLLSSTPIETDMWSLCSYLMSGRPKGESLLIADSQQKLISLVKSKKILNIRKITNNDLFDMAMEIVCHNPYEIYIDARNCSDEIIDAMRNLFCIKILS